MSLSDKGDPGRTNTQQYTVTVNVIRNDADPLFFTQSYYTEINENVAVGTRVLNVNATDSDPNVSQFEITVNFLAFSWNNYMNLPLELLSAVKDFCTFLSCHMKHQFRICDPVKSFR